MLNLNFQVENFPVKSFGSDSNKNNEIFYINRVSSIFLPVVKD
jgi:hypothetical protein